MPLIKNAIDLLGTSSSKITVNAGASQTSTARNATTLIGITVCALITYSGSIPATDPYIEVFTSPDNSNFDTEAYETFYLPRVISTTKMISIPIRFTENIRYYQVKITNGATNSITCWVSSVESYFGS